MIPRKKIPIEFWHIYEQILNPTTKTIPNKYLLPLLTSQYLYCKLIQQPLSMVILDFPALSGYNKKKTNHRHDSLIKNISKTIRNNLRTEDAVLYNNDDEFILLLPKVAKGTLKSLLERIQQNLSRIYLNKHPLIVRGAFGAIPDDAVSPWALEKCIKTTLTMVNKLPENRIIGHFTEKRQAIRVPLQVEIRYITPRGKQHLCCSRNISTLGIQISSRTTLPLGRDITLNFTLPNTKKTLLQLRANTVWNNVNALDQSTDIGLYFIDLNQAAKQRLARYIRKNTPSSAAVFNNHMISNKNDIKPLSSKRKT